MNTQELINFINKDYFAKKIFCGVKALDELSSVKIKKPCAFIVNTHKSYQPGEHWFAIYIPINGPVEIFDSFGIKPKYFELYKFIKSIGKRYIYNRFELQHNLSNTCGKYSLLYILFRSRGYTYKNIINFFTKNTLINDKIIINIFKKTYNEKS